MSGPPDPINLAERRPKRKPAPAGAAWLKDAITDDRGRPVANLANTMLALRRAPELLDVVALDEMLAAPMLIGSLPAIGDEAAEVIEAARPVRDDDVTAIQEWIQHAGLPRIGRETVHQAVDARARERAFHPVRDWLDSREWDGAPRIGEWLSTYLGAEATPYTAGIGRMFLVAMVARIYRPGCKADYLMVLEGPQGARKSTACAILGGAWFSDSLPDVTAGKDVAQHLPGKWLIEVGELSALSKAGSAHLKAFITRPVERYRPSYGRREVVQPRQCIFIGTTNQAAYLKDETGGRRFWPVKVGAIDTDSLARDRDQLFAEAAWAFRQGERWWPDQGFEREFIAKEQEARFEADAWADEIRDFLKGRSQVLIGEIARGALAIEVPRLGRTEQLRIAAILISEGWRRSEKKDRRGNWPWSKTLI